MHFGTLLKKLRLDKNLTLREFSRRVEYDASNISKIERGVLIPPPTIVLKKWSRVLGLDESKDEYASFLDNATIARDRLPEDTPEKVKNVILPALFRTSRSEKLTKEDYERLIKILNKE